MAAATIEKPVIEFNEMTFESFTKQGLQVPDGVEGGVFQKQQNDKFMARFKPEKGPLRIVIDSMHRRQVITYDKDGKAVKKEYLTFRASYFGRDWLGNDLPPIRGQEHGRFLKPKFSTTIHQDMTTGDQIAKKEYLGQTEVVCYIELTDKNRKQIIQDIINESNGTLTDKIVFYGHFPDSARGRAHRNNLFSFDQFINSSFDELERLTWREGGPQGNCVPYVSKDKKSYHG